MSLCSGHCPSFCIVVDKMERTSAKKRFKSLAGICKAGKMLQHLQLAERTKYQFLQTVTVPQQKQKGLNQTGIETQHKSRASLRILGTPCHLLFICMILVCAMCSLQGAHWENPIWTGHTVCIFWILVGLDASDLKKTTPWRGRMLVLKLFWHLRQITVWHVLVTFLANLYRIVCFLGGCIVLPRNGCSLFCTHSTQLLCLHDRQI